MQKLIRLHLFFVPFFTPIKSYLAILAIYFYIFPSLPINKYIHSKLESNSCVETELHYFNFCGKWKIHLYHDLLKYCFNYINSIFRIFCSSGSHVTFIYYKNAQNVTQCYSTDSKKVSNWAVFTLKPAYWKRSMLIYVYIPFEFVGYFVLCFKINIHANILCMIWLCKVFS